MGIASRIATFLGDNLYGTDGIEVEAPIAEHSSSLEGLILSTRLQAGLDLGSEIEKVPAIYRAKTMTTDAIAQLPVAAWRGTELLRDQPRIVTRPDDRSTLQEFVHATMEALQYGESYWLLSDYGPDGRPTAARVLPREEVTVTWNGVQKDKRVYQYRNQTLRVGGLFPQLAVISLDRGASDLRGLGPMNSKRLPGIAATLAYQAEYFRNNGNPTGVLSVPGGMDNEEATKLRAQWVADRTTRSPAVLSGGMSWEATGFSMTDSAWTDAYYSTIVDVANLWGIPSVILGYAAGSQSQTYQNLSDVWESWWRSTLLPTYAARIAGAWSELVPRGTVVRFDPANLTRLGASQRADFYTKALDPETGWLTTDEVRALEGVALTNSDLQEVVT